MCCSVNLSTSNPGWLAKIQSKNHDDTALLDQGQFHFSAKIEFFYFIFLKRQKRKNNPCLSSRLSHPLVAHG